MEFQCRIPEWFTVVLDWWVFDDIDVITFDTALEYLFNNGIVKCIEFTGSV